LKVEPDFYDQVIKSGQQDFTEQAIRIAIDFFSAASKIAQSITIECTDSTIAHGGFYFLLHERDSHVYRLDAFFNPCFLCYGLGFDRPVFAAATVGADWLPGERRACIRHDISF
jgi:hypothetical protein